MADFTGSTRTNYFRVKDEDAFRGIMVRALSRSEERRVGKECM